jgi:hypothetical protein
MPWSEWVSTPEAHARASGRRGYNKKRQAQVQVRRQELHRLSQYWGTGPAAKVHMARVLKVSVRTIGRDLQAMAEHPPIPLICPTCGLPSRLDVDPSTLTDDPAELAALERAFARLLGIVEGAEAPRPRRRRSTPPVARLTRASDARAG